MTKVGVCASCGLHPFDYTVAEFDAEIDRERDRANRAESERDGVTERLKEAREALEFYAAEKQYVHRSGGVLVLIDRGDRARAVLAEGSAPGGTA
jgi:predicted  nucleic acid-binding Zn-ribbon protein